jgi:selenocysteine lyase/cysteine desulfurase
MAVTAPADAGVFRDRYPIFDRAIYLNSCSLGALSVRARARVDEYLDLWQAMGASAWYEIWWAALADLRARYGRLIGAAPGSVALHAHLSSALTSVAESLDYSRRNRVVVTALDFPTIAYQWMVKAPRGVEVVVLESPDGVRVPLEAFEAAIDDRTALVATSHVFFATGAIQDAAAIAQLAHRRGALCLIDGYQGVGQLPVDVTAMQVDFYCAGGLKWLMGGSGIAFLYAAPHLTPNLFPQATGWFAHREQFRFDPRHFAPHDDARRFEQGTPAVASVYAQLGGLEALEELGPAEARRITSGLVEDLVETARGAGITPKVAPTAAERSGIVMLPSPDPKSDVARLAAAGFIADARPGHVRVSPWFYNVPDDHRALIPLLARG